MRGSYAIYGSDRYDHDANFSCVPVLRLLPLRRGAVESSRLRGETGVPPKL